MSDGEKRKIKLVFMTSSNLREWGGIEHVLREYVSNRPENIDVIIVQPVDVYYARVSEDFIKENFDGVQIISVPYPFSKFNFLKKTRIGFLITDAIITSTLGFLYKYFLERKFLSKIGNPNIVYLFNKSDAFSYFTRRRNVLIVGSDHAWSLRKTDFLKAIQIKLIKNRLLLRNIDTFHLFPVSDRLPANIDSFVLANGVDTTKFQPKLKKAERVQLLFFARLEGCKGVPLILEIWRQIRRRSGIELYIAGSGPMEDIVRAIKDHNFKYLGFVDEENLPRLIAECDIFIYPSTCDNYPLVVSQALSSGLYVITNDMIASSFREFERLGQLKVVENKPSKYVEAINHYLENGRTFDLNESRSVCINKYDWKVISEKLYEELMRAYYRKTSLYQ